MKIYLTDLLKLIKPKTSLDEYNELYKIISESPTKIKSVNMEFDENSKNYNFTKAVKDFLKKRSDTFEEYSIYSYKSGKNTIDLFIYNDGDLTSANFMYEVKGGFIL
jgi:hypothetical protein